MAPEEVPSQPGDENEEAEEWPELTSIAAIIQRARLYAAKHHCAINLSFHVELTGLTQDQVKEKFIFSGSPGKGSDPDSAEYKKILGDIKKMVTEEMQAAFHGSVQDLDKDELEELAELENNARSKGFGLVVRKVNSARLAKNLRRVSDGSQPRS